MDVNRTTFWHRLPEIIETISLSKAVSIDLEMSGISKKQSEERENPTLKQKYEDARQAAETFAILQVGLTCILWEEAEASYVTKTFNFPLTPGFLGGDSISNELATKIEREICFSSKTIAFLQANNFNLSHVLNHGVPYLSAAEANDIRGSAFVEKKSSVEAHIDISKCPHETQKFYKTIESEIQTWISARMFQENRSNTLKLENPYEGRFHRFQKRLIHQLVETKFSGHRAYSKNGSRYMEITRRDPEADTNARGRAMDKRLKAIARQTGFRHIWDALCGGHFTSLIDAELIVGNDAELTVALRKSFWECETRLREKRPIVVGHNMLWDLCFLFRTFQGRLPESVDAFQKLVGEKMPKIVDTKYLFTRGDHEMMPDQSLEECLAAVKDEEAPRVKAPLLYRYLKAAPHEAGYDSKLAPHAILTARLCHPATCGLTPAPHPPGWMTAVVFLKKSFKLSQDKRRLGVTIPGEDPGEGPAPTRPNRFARATRVPTGSWADAPRGRRGVSTSDSLLDTTADDEELMLRFEPLKPTISTSASTPVILSKKPDAASEKSLREEEEEEKEEKKNMEDIPVKIPEWDDGVFWKRYGNKVRVAQSALMMYTGRR